MAIMAPRIVADAFYRAIPYRKTRAWFAGLESPCRPKKETGNFSLFWRVIANVFRGILRIRGAFDILGRHSVLFHTSSGSGQQAEATRNKPHIEPRPVNDFNAGRIGPRMGRAIYQV